MNWPTNTTKQPRETTITGKNQITLPTEAVRELGWERRDRLVAQVVGRDMLVLMRRPDSWADFFAGRLGHLFGTHEENLEWLDQERRSCQDLARKGRGMTLSR